MAVTDDYLDYIRDLLHWVPALRAKKMFGGYGLYAGDAFFAIVVENALYLKGDDEARDLYLQGGGARFSYLRQGKAQTMDYWSVPAEVLEEDALLHTWATNAIDAGLRAKR